MLKSLREFAQSTDFLLLARCLLAEVPRHYFPSVAALHDMRRLRNHPNGRIVDLDAYATHRWLVDGRGCFFFSIVAQRPRVSPPSRPGAVDGLLVP